MFREGLHFQKTTPQQQKTIQKHIKKKSKNMAKTMQKIEYSQIYATCRIFIQRSRSKIYDEGSMR